MHGASSFENKVKPVWRSAGIVCVLLVAPVVLLIAPVCERTGS